MTVRLLRYRYPNQHEPSTLTVENWERVWQVMNGTYPCKLTGSPWCPASSRGGLSRNKI